MIFRARLLIGFVLALVAAPLLADKLVFDHRLVPALKAVLDSGDPAMISYDNRNPRNVVDLIAVRGRSAQDWEEALVIIARLPDKQIATPADWLSRLQRDAEKQCPAVFTILDHDVSSITFERRSTGCRTGYPPVALYRVAAGKPSLFLLAAMTKTDFNSSARAEWLAMMASAHLE